MACSWERVSLSPLGKSVTPLGLGSGYGLSASDVERAVERGVNYIYWGSNRRPSFAEAMRNLGPRKRDDLVLVVQSYTRLAGVMGASLERALWDLGTDYADVLLLGWWDEPPPRKVLDAALKLKEAGKTRSLLISCHRRETFASYIADPAYDGIMVRYNAAHPGAESEVFPLLSKRRPFTVAYTATRWRALLKQDYMPPGERLPRASDCYRFVLSNPSVDVCLTGPRDAAELDEALTALDRGPLSEDEMAWMRRVGAHVHAAAKDQRFSRMVRVGDRFLGLMNLLSQAVER